jgi:hypothetical protein
MSGNEIQNDDFCTRYTALMVSAWHDEAIERRLLADPRAEAVAAGLPVHPGAAVVLDRSQPEGLFTKAGLLQDWNDTTGRHVLHVPAAPLIDLNELDEQELELLAGGSSEAITIVIVVCIIAA